MLSKETIVGLQMTGNERFFLCLKITVSICSEINFGGDTLLVDLAWC